MFKVCQFSNNIIIQSNVWVYLFYHGIDLTQTLIINLPFRLHNCETMSWRPVTRWSSVNVPLARMKAVVSIASSTRLRSFSAFSSHCFFSRSKCSTDAWLLGFIKTMWPAFTTCGTKSAAYSITMPHVIIAVSWQNWNNFLFCRDSNTSHAYNCFSVESLFISDPMQFYTLGWEVCLIDVAQPS